MQKVVQFVDAVIRQRKSDLLTRQKALYQEMSKLVDRHLDGSDQTAAIAQCFVKYNALRVEHGLQPMSDAELKAKLERAIASVTNN